MPPKKLSKSLEDLGEAQTYEARNAKAAERMRIKRLNPEFSDAEKARNAEHMRLRHSNPELKMQQMLNAYQNYVKILNTTIEIKFVIQNKFN